MRFLLAIGLVFALGGCAVVAVPPAVTIASYAVDGVSYIATGKSLTDHAISEVAGEDCVLIRAAVLEHPCRDHVEPDSALAVELETRYGGEAVSTELAEADLAAGGDGTAEGALASAAPPEGAPARYVVVGSYRNRANAKRARRRHAEAGAAVVRASVGGRPVFRVVMGGTSGIASGAHWAIAPCAAGLGTSSKPCLDGAAIAQVRALVAPRQGDGVESAALPPGLIADSSTAPARRSGRPGG